MSHVSMRRSWIRTSFAGQAVFVALGVSAGVAHAANVSLVSSPADFEIRKELNPASPNFGNLTTQSQSDTTLDVWYSGSESEYRAFAEFDLSSLAGNGPTISAAQFKAFRTTDIYPGGKVSVYGATVNRADVLGLAAPATLNEFASPDYALLSSNFAPNVAPNEAAASFSLDVTAYLQARYNDYLNNPSLDTVILRLQSPGTTGTDIRFASGDNATTANRPTLAVTVVPEPWSAALLAGAALGMMRRRRSSRR